jgi:murein DD-endopeptidase MepM/ murein hydrolase activator NlpD
MDAHRQHRGRRLRFAGAVALLAAWASGGIALAGGGGIGAPPAGQGAASGQGGGVSPGADAGLGSGQYTFPLTVEHTFGDGYGAGRDHEGQDLFARCGAAVLAARAGRVQRVDVHRGAGNYIVIDGQATQVDAMYAHLLFEPTIPEGARVRMGQRIGRVGKSGNASACHLHFELWSGPGWFEGGHPLPSVGRLLRAWDPSS